MCEDIVAAKKGACTPSSGVLPIDFETPREGSCDSSGETALPYGRDFFKTPNHT